MLKERPDYTLSKKKTLNIPKNQTQFNILQFRIKKKQIRPHSTNLKPRHTIKKNESLTKAPLNDKKCTKS